MTIRWLWLNNLPPGLPLSTDERREVLRRVREHRSAEPRYRGTAGIMARTMFLSIIPISLLFAAWIFLLVTLRLPASGFVPANIGGILLYNAALWTCITWAVHRTSTPYIRKALCDMGKPVCMECGYILYGLDRATSSCPECGVSSDAPAEQLR